MSFLRNNRLLAFSVALVLISLGLWAHNAFKPIPVNTDFITDEYSFTYPRSFATEEYAPGVVSIGHRINGELLPFVDVNEYKSDPEGSLPKTFDIFAKQQTEAFCGSDNSLINITCRFASTSAYTSPKGLEGQKMSLTAVRKNLKTGTSTSETYGPIYVFNTTPAGPREADIPFRYSGIFIYQSFTAFVIGTSSPELLDQVVGTFAIPKQN